MSPPITSRQWTLECCPEGRAEEGEGGGGRGRERQGWWSCITIALNYIGIMTILVADLMLFTDKVAAASTLSIITSHVKLYTYYSKHINYSKSSNILASRALRLLLPRSPLILFSRRPLVGLHRASMPLPPLDTKFPRRVALSWNRFWSPQPAGCRSCDSHVIQVVM